MLRFYPLVILIQLYCLYHAYNNKSDQKWFWIIIFFPLIGSLFYLYDNFYSRKNIENIKEEVKGSFVGNYSINKLEQKVKFSNTFSNKMELANEHLSLGNYNRAIELFESCNTGTFKDDIELNLKLIQVYYLKENYTKVLKYGEQLEGKKEYKNSSERSAVAWAHFYLGQVDEADNLFSSMDTKYSNYKSRLEYVYFLQETKSNTQAKSKIDELLEEIDAMDSNEKRINKKVIKNIKYLSRQIRKQV